MTEEWRQIPLLPTGYEASSFGRIRSFRRSPDGIVLTGYVSKKGTGYLTTCLQGKNWSVHVLVAATFIGPRPDGMETRHVDGDKTNNRPSNLAYGTHSENIQDQVRHGVHNMASKTCCSKGHEFTPENTRFEANGSRSCRACSRAKARRTRETLYAQGLTSRGTARVA